MYVLAIQAEATLLLVDLRPLDAPLGSARALRLRPTNRQQISDANAPIRIELKHSGCTHLSECPSQAVFTEVWKFGDFASVSELCVAPRYLVTGNEN